MLNNYQTLQSNFPSSIKNIENPYLITSGIQTEIDSCWQRQQERCEGKLFDGRLFSVTQYTTNTLEGCFVPYSWYIAWLYCPDIRKYLPLCPLGVSGLTYSSKHLLIGRRTATVADYPLAYECVPSGGVDHSCLNGSTIDILKLLKRELLEEAAIAAESIIGIQPLGLVLDKQQSTLEMCVALEITQDALLHAKAEPSEYSELVTVEIAAAEEFLQAKDRRAVVPLSMYMWNLWRLDGALPQKTFPVERLLCSTSYFRLRLIDHLSYTGRHLQKLIFLLLCRLTVTAVDALLTFDDLQLKLQVIT
jgi:hypothetical protein